MKSAIRYNRFSASPAAPPQWTLFLIAAYLVAMFFLTLLRLFFLVNFSDAAATATAADILEAFLIGLRFDQIVVLMPLIPLLLLLPFADFKSRGVRLTALTYIGVVFTAFFILLLADIRFYKVFDTRLNFLAVEYIGDGAMFGDLITSDPMFYPYLFIWLGGTASFLGILIYFARRIANIAARRSWKNHLVYFLVVAALFGLGIRGRLNLAPMDWGLAYFSDSRFLNQLALNGVYTLGRNLNENDHDPRLSYMTDKERFPFVDDSVAIRTVQKMLSQRNERWLQPESSLVRTTFQPPAPRGFQPNLIIVMMESWAAEHTGVLGSPRDLTPNFDRLAAEGLLFTNFFAAGTRTNYGLAATLCSFPAIPGRSIMKRYNAHHPFVSLSELLHDRGYFNAFAYGGDIAFDNMQGFFRQKKYNRFYGDRDLAAEESFSKWGVPDHALFENVEAIADSLPRPFQLTVLTLSNHEPFDLPDSSVQRYHDDSDSSKIFNAQLYADFAMGKFMLGMRRRPVFDSTIFVFVSDHTRIDNSPLEVDPKYFHIPLLIYSPGLLGKDGRRIETYGGQVDVLPTIMGFLGGDYTHSSWGRNLLNPDGNDDGYAMMSIVTRIGYLDQRHLYYEDLGRKVAWYANDSTGFLPADDSTGLPVEFQTCPERLRQFMQLADQLSTPHVP